MSDEWNWRFFTVQSIEFSPLGIIPPETSENLEPKQGSSP